MATEIPGYSGTGYVTGFDSSDCYLGINFSVNSAGLHEVIIGYHSAMDKGFVFQVNNNPPSSGTFKSTGDTWGRVSAGKFLLQAGVNKAFVRDGWGYYQVVRYIYIYIFACVYVSVCVCVCLHLSVHASLHAVDRHA